MKDKEARDKIYRLEAKLHGLIAYLKPRAIRKSKTELECPICIGSNVKEFNPIMGLYCDDCGSWLKKPK